MASTTDTQSENATHFLDSYETTTTVYKIVNGHEIQADISFPKGLKPGRHPVIVNWHGGGLITGSRNYELVFQPWLYPFALEHSAILVSPDYRLLPEAKIEEVWEDLETFWAWMHSQLPAQVEQISHGVHQADISRVVLNGGSAGGWAAALQAFAHPDEVKGVMVQYPVLIRQGMAKGAPGPDGKEFFGMSMHTKEDVERWVASLEPGSIVSADTDFERLIFGFSAGKHGLTQKWMGTEDRFDPIALLKDGVRLPPKFWIIHGLHDSVIDVKDTKEFVAKAESVRSNTEFRAEYFDGGDHGFDRTIEYARLQDGLNWIASAW